MLCSWLLYFLTNSLTTRFCENFKCNEQKLGKQGGKIFYEWPKKNSFSNFVKEILFKSVPHTQKWFNDHHFIHQFYRVFYRRASLKTFSYLRRFEQNVSVGRAICLFQEERIVSLLLHYKFWHFTDILFHAGYMFQVVSPNICFKFCTNIALSV